MKRQSKNNLLMIGAGIFFIFMMIILLLPESEEIKFKEVDPGDEFDGMTAEKFKTLSGNEQKKYVEYVRKSFERYNYHKSVIIDIPSVLAEDFDYSETPAEVVQETTTGNEPEITPDPEPADIETAEEVVQENINSEETDSEDRPAEVIPDLKAKRADLSRENITQSDKTFEVDQWEAEIFRERISADEPTSMAVLAERFKISESEVLEIEGELIEKLNADIHETEPKKPELIQESIEEKLESKPETIQEKQASIEEKPETILASKPEKPASVEESIQETVTDNEIITGTVEETTEKREPGEHEKKCALCDAIIPKYPPNSKLCSNCKVKATEAGMKHKDFISQELAKKGGNDE